MRLAVIIAAAGASRRFGERSKLDADLGGKSVLQRSVELFKDLPELCAIIVAGPFDDEAHAGFRARHGDMLAFLGAIVCKGGREKRWETVQAALAHVPEDATHIAVHDAARPGAPAAMLERLMKAAQRAPAVVPAVDVADTLKRVAAKTTPLEEVDAVRAALLGESAAGLAGRAVEETLSRERVVAVQTPQVFAAELLKRAYAQADLTSTDDAFLVEKLGETVLTVAGDPRAMKITRPSDAPLLMAMLGLKPPKDRAAHKRF